MQLVGVRVAPCWQVLEITEVPLAVLPSLGDRDPSGLKPGCWDAGGDLEAGSDQTGL